MTVGEQISEDEGGVRIYRGSRPSSPNVPLRLRLDGPVAVTITKLSDRWCLPGRRVDHQANATCVAGASGVHHVRWLLFARITIDEND